MADPTPTPGETFSGDNFSNNLVSDLGPLLALFGEQVAKQFMSDSMGWADNIIFAMAPLGIITAIVGAIRVGGPRWLKAIIGRARENRATAEVELMSSTSHEVCELWNGQQVVRITGAPPIRELIYLIPTIGSEDTLATVRSGNIYTLREAPKTDSDNEKCYLKRMEKVSFWLERLIQFKPPTSDPESTLEQSPVEPASSTRDQNSSPNISLNIHHPMMRRELWLWAAVATFLQLGVLVYDAFATYRLKLKEGGGKVVYYAFPLTSAGTLALVLGMLLCSYVIESSTIEEVYQVERAEARLLWLQRKATVSDQSFDSYLIFPKNKSKFIRTSRRDARLNARGDDGHERHEAAEDLNSSLAPEVITILGVFISFCGFIIQFIGLRAMHWSASLAQLGVTLIMIVVRAWIRRGLAKLPYAQRLPSGHELDWLATRREHFWYSSDHENDGRTVLCRVWDFLCRRSPPPPVQILPRATEFMFDLGFITSGQQGLVQKPDSQRDITMSNGPEPSTKEVRNTAQNVMEIRKRLGSLTEWPGPASEKATSIASAIEIVMNTLFLSTEDELFWSMNTSSNESVQFKLRREGGKWEADVAEIDAALSLWLFSVGEEEQKVTSKYQVQSDSAWLRNRVASRKQGIQLLGSSTLSSRRDMRWWVGSGISRVLEVKEVTSDDSKLETEEVSDGTAVTIDNHRVVGSVYLAPAVPEQINTLKSKRYQTRQIAGDPTSDHQISEDLLSDPPTQANESWSLATISDLPLEFLFAQHMFSAFMRAFANTPTVARVNGQATVQLMDKDISHNSKAWKYFALQNPQLSEMVRQIQRTGLGNLEEIFMSIIPALSFANKLPEATAIVQLAEKQAKKQELSGRWDEAGKLYLWAFRTCITLGSKDKSAIQATATLVEFLRSISIIATTRENQRRAKETFTTLQRLGSNLSKVLSESAGPNALHDLTILYEIQNRTEGYKSWKPPSADTPTFSEDWPEYQWTKLHKAIVDGEPESKVKALLEEGENPNSSDILGWTPLHYAVEKGNVNAMELLLAPPRYANPNLADIAGWTPLHYAARNPKGALLSKLLWDKGAEVDVQGRDGLAPLHCAAREGNVKMIELLIKSGAKLDVKDNARRTPLHWAACKGSGHVVKLLMERGADPHCREEYGRTPLHLAAGHGNRQTLRAFLEIQDARIESMDELGRTSLHLAAEGGHDQVVGELLRADAEKESQDRSFSTPLLLASREGRLAATKTLLEAGAQREARQNDGLTALHLAAGNGHEPTVKILLDAGVDKEARQNDGLAALHLAARNGHEPTVKILLDAGVDKEARDKDEQTALHQATHTGHIEVVKLLLHEKADKEARSNLGKVPLHLAVGLGNEAMLSTLLEAKVDKEAKDKDGATSLLVAVQGGYLAVTKTLLEEGADKDTIDHFGWSILHAAANGGKMEMVEMLLALDMDINARTTDQQTALHLAAGSENGTILELLLAAKADKEAKDSDNWTPLLSAAMWGRRQPAKVLLAEGANIEAKSKLGQTALHLAAVSGSAVVLELLLELHADIEATDDDQQTALHQAASRGHEMVVQALLKAGADKEAKAKHGQTALHRAASRGHEVVVQALLEVGADIESKTNLGQTALHLAAVSGSEAVLMVLLKYADIEATDDDQQTALHQAASRGHEVVVQALLKAGADKEAREKLGRTALHLAARLGNEAVLLLLLKAGAKTEVKDNDGWTSLVYAARWGGEQPLKALLEVNVNKEAKDSSGRTSLHIASRRGHMAMTDTLLRFDADIKATDNDQQTALHQAASRGQEVVVQALLDAGADIEAKAKHGQTALHRAASRGHKVVVRTLLKAGADKEAKTKIGQTALHLAARRGHEEIVMILLRERVNMEVRDELYGQTALHQAAFGGHDTVVAALLKAGLDLECRDKSYSQTALHLAAYAGNETVVAILLEAGADTTARDVPNGQTPLHQAAYVGHENVLKALLGAKVDIEARDEDGWTSLFYAAMHGQNPIVQMLLDAGADKEARTKSGWTALHEAAKRGYTAVVQSLLTAGVEKDRENDDGQTALQIAVQYGHRDVVTLLVTGKGE